MAGKTRRPALVISAEERERLERLRDSRKAPKREVERGALMRQLQQLDYEARRASDQYNQVDPTNRLVAEVLEQRWDEKLEARTKLKTELDAEKLAAQPLSRAEQEAMVALGENFASVWMIPPARWC